MAMGFAVLVGIGVLVLSIAAFGYYGIPVGIVLTGVFVGFAASRAKKAAGPGPGGEASRPHDTAGGPTHKREEYAHTGQAYMTPEQMKRARA